MQNNINHKPLFFDKLIEFSNKYPEYTLGEMVYSILKQIPNFEVPLENRKYFLYIEDSHFYTGIDRAVKSESEI